MKHEINMKIRSTCEDYLVFLGPQGSWSAYSLLWRNTYDMVLWVGYVWDDMHAIELLLMGLCGGWLGGCEGDSSLGSQRGLLTPPQEEEVRGLTCHPTAYLLLGRFLPRESRGGALPPPLGRGSEGPNVPPTSYLLLELGQAWRLQAPWCHCATAAPGETARAVPRNPQQQQQ